MPAGDREEKQFDSEDEARAVCARLNETPPELGWSPWYLGHSEGSPTWYVMRARGVMAEDLEQAPSDYEEALRSILEKAALLVEDDWIRMESVSLEGEYPDTQLVRVFRVNRDSGQPLRRHSVTGCRFGARYAIWPAEYSDPEQEAMFSNIYFDEAVGTEGRFFVSLHGVNPCDPERINWITDL